MTEFHKKSHELHREHHAEQIDDRDLDETARSWLRDDTVYSWRQERMLGTLDPILTTEPDSRWLTIGDGRLATEARFIENCGCEALPTDISVELLAEAKRRGLVDDYSEENAEELSFDDESFGYVLCKQSYHHFPRPYIALYEMLRVADRGVVLIEPNDSELHGNVPSEPLLRRLLNGLKRLRDDDDRVLEPPIFEPSGNYVFSISRREIEKVALGLDHAAVAFKGINDYYIDGCEDEELSERGPIYLKTRAVISTRDLLCRLRLAGHSKLVAIVFKRPPSDELVDALERDGYDVTRLPDNPHIDD